MSVQHVVATAGHVDHGKSSLVRALTGMEPDRFEEERRRGLTLDLGYAWFDLDPDTTVAFVDVPGHARFTGTMLAGVGPVPAALLVVAADEGWSRQTTEHVAALDALGVRHGLLAVTRSDLADPDLALAEAQEHLATTSLGGVEGVGVSSVTGAGLSELRDALRRLVGSLPEPAPTDRLRLWVDRSFSIRGSGTVVTGTLARGRLALGDELEVLPDGRRGRIRGLQSLQVRAEEIQAVARVAVNLRGVDRGQVPRGSALTTPGAWRATTRVDARLTLTGVAPPGHVDSSEAMPTVRDLPRELILHVGSAAVSATVRPLSVDVVRLTLATPLPLQVGDVGVLRDPGVQAVAAGVLVLDPAPPELRRRGAASRRAAELQTVDGTLDPFGEVSRRGPSRRSDLAALGVLPAHGPVPAGLVEVGGFLTRPETVARWRAALGEAVDAYAAAHPLDGGMPREAARHELALPDLKVLETLVVGLPDIVDSGGRLHRPQAGERLPPEVEQALRALQAALADAPFASPEVGDIVRLGLTPSVLSVLERAGLVLRLPGPTVLLADAEEAATRRLAALPQPFTMAQARTALGTSRRVAVPLLEHLDRRRRTRRLDTSLREVISPVVPG